jgi:transcriptional regulator with XRE-family HTH domain
MDGEVGRPPATAAVLQKWRTLKRLSKQRLAELSDVSATYVRTIEAGFDDDGRPVVPSAGVIQKLARGLARAEPDAGRQVAEERRAFSELMAAAGYLGPGGLDPGLRPGEAASTAEPTDASTSGVADSSCTLVERRTAPEADRPASSLRLSFSCLPSPTGSGVAVILRDQRLHRHCRELLECWEQLSSEDQALILGIMEFVAERRQRRESQV